MTAGLRLFTIYASPLDYPGKYVVREWYSLRCLIPAAEPLAVADTLAEARAAVPAGLYCMPRVKGDELQIVETWL